MKEPLILKSLADGFTASKKLGLSVSDRSHRCDGMSDCLPGDTSDEVGCYLPYIMCSTGALVLAVVLAGTTVCLYQHHSRMASQGMTRYNQDLVRRKDKVKARKAENKVCVR